MHLYLGCNGHVVAVNPADGSEIWRTALTAGFLASVALVDVAVLEHDGTVFAGSNGHLFALDGETGEIIWHNHLEGLGHNDVSLTMLGKSVQFASSISEPD